MPPGVAFAPHVRRAALALVLASILAIGYFTLTPAAGRPGATFLCVVCGSRGGVDAVLNVLLFMPLGFGLELSGMRARRAITAMAILSACIEATQFMALPGRDATLGDILMNSLGGTLGVMLARSAFRLMCPGSRLAMRACVIWSVLWLAVQALGSFAFAPSLPETRYYGQLGRTFASMATFRGAILEARIDSAVVPNERMSNSAAVRALLSSGHPVSAIVVPGGETPRLAPIVRIADDHREEIVVLGQDGWGLVYGLRTGAAVLRVRPPLFRLEWALRSAAATAHPSAGGTVRLHARYGPVVHIGAEGSGAPTTRDIRAGPGLSWTLILPQQWYIEGTRTEAVITWLWVAVGLLPLGFWSAWLRARDASNRGVWPVVTIAFAAALATGLWVLPRWFGVAPAGPGEWMAAVAGLTAARFTAGWARRYGGAA